MNVQFLQRIVLAVAQAQNVSAVLQLIVQGLAEEQDIALARIWLIAPGDLCASCHMKTVCPDQTRCLQLVASAGNAVPDVASPSLPGHSWTSTNGHFRRIPLNAPLKVGYVGGTGQGVLLQTDDLGEKQHWIAHPEWARSQRILSFAGQPLISKESVLGVLGVFSRQRLTGHEFEWLRTFADHAAVAIVNAKTLEDREHAERALRESERRLHAFWENSPSLIFMKDLAGRYLYANPKFEKALGVDRNLLNGKTDEEMFSKEQAAAFRANDQRVLRTGIPVEFEEVAFQSDGAHTSIVHKFPLSNESGEIYALGGIATDITQRKRTEEKLRASEASLRSLTETIPQMLWSATPTGFVDYCNNWTLQYTGLSIEELQGAGWMKVVHPGDAEKMAEAWRTSVEAGTSFQHEFRGFRASDKSYRWCVSSALPMRAKDGSILKWYGSVVDLDDWKKAQESLRLSEERYHSQHDRLRLLLNLNNRIVSNLDLRQLFQILSAELQRMMGCSFVGLAVPLGDNKHLQLHLLEYSEGRGALEEGMLLPIHGSASGRAFRTAKPFILQNLEDARNDPEIYAAPEGEAFYRTVAAEGFKSGCFLPLISRNSTFGVLRLTKSAPHGFDQEDVDFLSQIASQIAIAVDNALNYQEMSQSRAQLAQEKLYLEEEIRKEHNFEEIVGNSPALLDLLRQVEQIAPTDSNVLIWGETGTGKELIARAIHARSSRKDRPMVKVNCGSIPGGLVESELFGHVKGAFTGASASRTGRFELANRSTLFLDEVGELPSDTQVKLLRVLQEQEFEPVGSSRTIRVDVRVVAATNRDLEHAVRTGQFRSDLYYRLNVLPLRVPALRDRPGDIPQIVLFFLDRFCKRTGKKIQAVSAKTMKLLEQYPWPGNIRELQNVIERGVVLCSDSILHLGPDLLPLTESPQKSIADADTIPQAQIPTFPQSSRLAEQPSDCSLEEVERRHILAVLKSTRGLISGSKGAAAILRLNPNTLRSRMKKLGIARTSYDIS